MPALLTNQIGRDYVPEHVCACVWVSVCERERGKKREREKKERERVNPVKSRCMMTEISKEIMKQLQRKTKIFRDSKFV